VPVWLPVVVALLEPAPVPVALDDAVSVWLPEPVALGEGVPVPVAVPVAVALREMLDSNTASERTPAPRTSQLPPPPASPSRVRTPA